MRKFKIKNRQKRKYEKRQTVASHLSSSKSIAISLVPMVFIVVALLTTAVIKLHPTDHFPNFQIDLSQPLFSYNAIIRFFQTLRDVSLPSALTFLHATVQNIQFALQNMLSFISDEYTRLIYFLTQLDPHPVLNGVGQNVTQTSNTLLSVIMGASAWTVSILSKGFSIFITSFIFISLQIVNALKYSFSVVINAINTALQYSLQVLTSFYQLRFNLHVMIVRGFAEMFFYIAHVAIATSIVVGKNVYTAMSILGNMIVSMAQLVGGKIMQFTQTAVNVLLIPFRIMGAYLSQFKPYVDFFMAHVNLSMTQIHDSFSNNFKAVVELSKSTSQTHQ